jgi:hypothetical protein
MASMPNKKNQHVLERMQLLKNFGNKILNTGEISEDEKKYIGRVFVLIGDGADPNEVLNIKGSGGRSSSKTRDEMERLNRQRLAITWIEHAMKPESKDGLGYNIEQAVGTICSDNANPQAGHFGFCQSASKTFQFSDLSGSHFIAEITC